MDSNLVHYQDFIQKQSISQIYNIKKLLLCVHVYYK
jgi:hypothetical protein